MNRVRVQHVAYGWVGEYYPPLSIDDVPAAWRAGWVSVKWDNGTASYEHTDDLMRLTVDA